MIPVSSLNNVDHNELARTTRGLDIDDGSSFTLKRFDMAPLCQVALLVEPAGPLVLEPASGTAPAIYIAALPFPGRTEGRRLTITEEDRGMI